MIRALTWIDLTFQLSRRFMRTEDWFDPLRSNKGIANIKKLWALRVFSFPKLLNNIFSRNVTAVVLLLVLEKKNVGPYIVIRGLTWIDLTFQLTRRSMRTHDWFGPRLISPRQLPRQPLNLLESLELRPKKPAKFLGAPTQKKYFRQKLSVRR